MRWLLTATFVLIHEILLYETIQYLTTQSRKGSIGSRILYAIDTFFGCHLCCCEYTFLYNPSKIMKTCDFRKWRMPKHSIITADPPTGKQVDSADVAYV